MSEKLIQGYHLSQLLVLWQDQEDATDDIFP